MALYYPKPVFPYTGDVIDPSVSNTFKYEIQGSSSCVAYQIIILGLNNVALYTGTKTTLSTPLYNGEELDISLTPSNLSGLVAGNAYKHKVLVYYTSTLYVTSLETQFWAYSTPTLSINMPSSNPHNLQYFNFTATYSQAQGVGIKEFTWKFYDGSMTLRDTYKKIGTGKTDYYRDGFKSGESYTVTLEVINQMGVSSTATASFSVLYNAAKFVLTPTIVNNQEYNSLDISWTASQIDGVPSDQSNIQYISPYIYNTNSGLHIDSGAYVDYSEITATSDFTYIHDFGIDNGFTGDLVYFTDIDNNNFILTYDGTNLIYKKNGVTLTSYNISSYGRNYWFVAMQSSSAVLFRFVTPVELYPTTTLYPNTTLYPLIIEDA